MSVTGNYFNGRLLMCCKSFYFISLIDTFRCFSVVTADIQAFTTVDDRGCICKRALV